MVDLRIERSILFRMPHSRRQSATWLAGILFACLVFATSPIRAHAASAWASGFFSAGAPRELKDAPGIREWSYLSAVGRSPFDKIGLHRLDRGLTPPVHPDAVVLYLPGTNMNGEIALENPRYSFQVYLAQQGIDVWSMDYRTHFIPPATPQSDLSELANWTNNLFESDINRAVEYICRITGRKKMFIAGFSRGGEFAYLYAATHPDRVQGIIALDGFIAVGPLMWGPMQPGHYADDIGGAHLTYEKRKKLIQMVIENPNQPAPIPKYKTAGENLEHVLYDSGGFFGGHGGLANPQGGCSSVSVLAHLLIGYDRYWPAIQDHEVPFPIPRLAALKKTKIPVIAFASTNISPHWAAEGKAASKATGAAPADQEFFAINGCGHLDVIAGNHSEKQVFAPTAAFIKRHLN
ncbi:MAG TPA: alpha/beta fold hydrolase [Candidatus Binataceae bacterium]|nr:alpha/beta fold hydrolase [Candidatus Binataceae bacterium]